MQRQVLNASNYYNYRTSVSSTRKIHCYYGAATDVNATLDVCDGACFIDVVRNAQGKALTNVYAKDEAGQPTSRQYGMRGCVQSVNVEAVFT